MQRFKSKAFMYQEITRERGEGGGVLIFEFPLIQREIKNRPYQTELKYPLLLPPIGRHLTCYELSFEKLLFTLLMFGSNKQVYILKQTHSCNCRSV